MLAVNAKRLVYNMTVSEQPKLEPLKTFGAVGE
jgi:hypothetical protein